MKHLATEEDVEAAQDEAAKLETEIITVLGVEPMNAAKLAKKVSKRKQTVLRTLEEMQ